MMRTKECSKSRKNKKRNRNRKRVIKKKEKNRNNLKSNPMKRRIHRRNLSYKKQKEMINMNRNCKKFKKWLISSTKSMMIKLIERNKANLKPTSTDRTRYYKLVTKNISNLSFIHIEINKKPKVK